MKPNKIIYFDTHKQARIAHNAYFDELEVWLGWSWEFDHVSLQCGNPIFNTPFKRNFHENMPELFDKKIKDYFYIPKEKIRMYHLVRFQFLSEIIRLNDEENFIIYDIIIRGKSDKEIFGKIQNLKLPEEFITKFLDVSWYTKKEYSKDIKAVTKVFSDIIGENSIEKNIEKSEKNELSIKLSDKEYNELLNIPFNDITDLAHDIEERFDISIGSECQEDIISLLSGRASKKDFEKSMSEWKDLSEKNQIEYMKKVSEKTQKSLEEKRERELKESRGFGW